MSIKNILNVQTHRPHTGDTLVIHRGHQKKVLVCVFLKCSKIAFTLHALAVDAIAVFIPLLCSFSIKRNKFIFWLT